MRTTAARFDSLQDWLRWQESLHPAEIELGLERVATVFARLHERHFACPVITLAGTNGKGSSLRLLEAVYRAAGYRTGAYMSPHLLRYNERIRLDGEEATDAAIMEAFARVDAARAGVSLTYFEFGTLAALDIFLREQPDVVLLEVGLGGRLDAVNIVDADVALITAIGLDHTEWLGRDRETIGFEKAGILRAGRPAICSDPAPPSSIAEQASRLGAPLYRLGRDFRFEVHGDGSWRWQAADGTQRQLPPPGLPGRHQYRNAAGVLMALHLLRARLPLSDTALAEGLQQARLPGRFQVEADAEGRIWIFDVAHNPDSVAELARMLASAEPGGRSLALLGMLADKDCAAALAPMRARIDEWHLAPLASPRSARPEVLAQILEGGTAPVRVHASMASARQGVMAAAGRGDRIVVFGSFHTVSEVMLAGS
ncbi:MAG TPA: bifunctional tetrahydrofolate synthase/dihydrofolate synthase [Aliiroseovarius sp.]|nr:bifunctional tetrahydrofolate synthase/dihydrofolate synthase [Aliiroseovarius sp.]